MDIITLRTFFLWCTIINAIILIGSSMIFAFASDWIYKIHNRFLNIPKETSKTVFYSFIGLYKMLWIVFNLVPYIALLIVG
jgi:hypothetical protein